MALRALNGYRTRNDGDIYLVLEDLGTLLGRAWPETYEDHTDRETMIVDLIAGLYTDPVRIVAFNSSEGWCRDVTVDIADELRRRYVEFDGAPQSILNFMDANRH